MDAGPPIVVLMACSLLVLLLLALIMSAAQHGASFSTFALICLCSVTAETFYN